jgi:hypothetical protein
MKKIIPLVPFLLFVLLSCNSRATQEKDADKRLKHIEQLINQNQLNSAKIEIDSIHSLYPRLVNKRRIAAALEDTILRRENSRTLAYCDSLLPIKQHEADSIQKNFRFEKNEKYQQFGNYVYKTQQTESNSNRNYLKAYVDENADFYLISNFCGGNIEHTSVEVSADDLFAHTDTLTTTNSAFHSFNDGGSHWESLTFKNEEDKGVSSFIAQNSLKRLKITLYGKKTYVYFLSDADKKAITETNRLWIVKKDIFQLHKEITKATKIIERITKFKNSANTKIL